MQWTDIVLWLRDHFGVPMMLAFLTIIVTAYWPRNKERQQGHALIPLRDDE